MGKFDTDEIGKPGKPPKYRPFPWRLWFYALVMTAGAGAGGYFTWQYRQQAMSDKDAAASCTTNLTKLQSVTADSTKVLNECKQALGTATIKDKELEGQLASLSTNLNASKDELTALRAQRVEADKRLAAISDIQKQFAKMIDTGTLKVTARRGSLVLSLPAEVLFPSGSAELSKPGELAVLEVGITLKKLADRRFLVIGHTDDQPLKNTTYKDNWELSTARALTVTRFLVQAGMTPKNLVAGGAGENDPVVPNTPKDRPRNRRIEIALLPALGELPPLPASLGSDTEAKPGDAKPADVKPGDAKPPEPKPPDPKP